MELMLCHATAGGGSDSRVDDEGSGRTGRVRVLSTFRTKLLLGTWTVKWWQGKIGGKAVSWKRRLPVETTLPSIFNHAPTDPPLPLYLRVAAWACPPALIFHQTSMPCSPETTLRVILSLIRSSGTVARAANTFELGMTYSGDGSPGQPGPGDDLIPELRI